MKKLLAVAVVFFGLAGTAHAALLNITLGANPGDITYSLGGGYTPNVDLSDAVLGGQLTFTGSGGLFTTSVADLHLAPSGPLFGGDFIAAHATPTPGTATYTLDPGQHALAFRWGSIDGANATRNVLTIETSDAITFTITGEAVANALIGFAQPFTNNVTDFDVVLTHTLGTILSATFAAGQNAFEAANFYTSEIPLPAALPLFAAALLAMGFTARRKMARKKI